LGLRRAMKLTKPPISIGLVREDILSLGERLEEVEAVGIVGSLAWAVRESTRERARGVRTAASTLCPSMDLAASSPTMAA